jgi:leader peptidase (prepilin peptidase)/N-methyltransferase
VTYAANACMVAGFAGFLGASGVLAVTDLRTHRLPTRIVYAALGLGAAMLTAAAAFDHAWGRLGVAGASAAGLAGVFWICWYFGQMGRGDVRLAAVLGLYLGWLGLPYLYMGMVVGMLSATVAVLASAALDRRRVRFGDTAPYGAYLCFGSWLAILAAAAR